MKIICKSMFSLVLNPSKIKIFMFLLPYNEPFTSTDLQSSSMEYVQVYVSALVLNGQTLSLDSAFHVFYTATIVVLPSY